MATGLGWIVRIWPEIDSTKHIVSLESGPIDIASAPVAQNPRSVWAVAPTPHPGMTEDLALFPLGTVLVPGMRLSLHAFEPRYRQLVADLLSTEDPAAPVFGVVALRQGWEVGELSDVFTIGTTARVTDVVPHDDGRWDVTAVGERRFAIESLDKATSPYLRARVRYLPEDEGDVAHAAVEAVRAALSMHLAALAALDTGPGGTVAATDAQELSYAVAQHSSLPLPDRQRLLECIDTADRLSAARVILRRERHLISRLRAVPATAAMFRAGLGSSSS
jgi:Lon protease-like protein